MAVENPLFFRKSCFFQDGDDKKVENSQLRGNDMMNS
jgi:hypothetical protein